MKYIVDLRRFALNIKYVTRIIPAMGVLLLSIVVAKHWPADQAGMVFIAISVSQLLSFISLLGTNTYLLREISRFDIRQYWEISNDILKVKISVVCSSIVLVVVSCFLNSYLHWWNESLTSVVISAPLLSLMTLNSSVLRAIGSVVWSGIFEYGIVAFLMLVLIELAVFGSGSVSISYLGDMYFFSSVLAFMSSEIVVRKNKQKFCGMSTRILRPGPIFFYSWRLGALSIIVYLTQWLPIYLVQTRSLEAVTIITLAYRFATVIGFIGVTVDLAMAPRLARYGVAINEAVMAKDLVMRSVKVLFFAALFGIVVMEALVVVLDDFFYSGRYQYLGLVTLISLVSAGGMLTLSPFSNVLLMYGFERHNSNVAMAGFIITTSLTWLVLQSNINDYRVAVFCVIVYAAVNFGSAAYLSYKSALLLNKNIVGADLSS